ncbi:MAG: hypothetical protein AAB860_00330 [Patescibacteria group bacterium]
MKESSVLKWIDSNIRRIERVQQDIVDRMNVWDLKRLGYKSNIKAEPLNVPFGCALGLMTCLEFYFFRSIFEILTGEELLIIKH